MFKRVIVFTAAVLALAPVVASALDLTELRVNGFASQTYLKSSENNFLVEDSKEGTFQFNEFGLTVNAPLGDRLKAGIQFLGRDFGEEGNGSVNVDWAYGDYRAADWLGLRFGLIKQPMGLYNEGRDTDFLRPTALLPQSIYSEIRRSYSEALAGAGLYGNISLGGAGNIDYQYVAGNTNADPNVYDVRATMNLVNSMFVPGAAYYDVGGTRPFTGAVTDMEWRQDEPIVDIAVVYNTPVPGLRLGVSWQNLEGYLEALQNGTPYVPPAAIDINGPAPGGIVPTGYSGNNVGVHTRNFTVYSLEYATPRFTISSECNLYDNETTIFGQTLGLNKPLANYLLVSVPVSGGFTLNALYDQYYPNRDEKDDPSEYRKDLGIGFRWDVTPNFILKAEAHDVEGTAGVDGQGYLNPDPDGFGPASGMEDEWDYYVVKATVLF